jgi:hypothetical protein
VFGSVQLGTEDFIQTEWKRAPGTVRSAALTL